MFSRLLPLTLTAAAVSLLAPLSAARADIKITQNRTTTGSEDVGLRGVPFTVNTYYKGDKYREEFVGRNYVHIYDATNDKFYTLDRSRMQYSVRRLDDVLDEKTGVFGASTVEGAANIVPGGSSKTIGGKKSSNYTVKMAVRIQNPSSRSLNIGLRMEGDLWATEEVVIPPKLVRIAKAGFGYGIFTFNKLLKPLMDKMNEVHGLPLSYDMILTQSGATNGTIEAHSEVKSISTAKLPDYLFVVPKGYQLVNQIIEKNSDTG